MIRESEIAALKQQVPVLGALSTPRQTHSRMVAHGRRPCVRRRWRWLAPAVRSTGGRRRTTPVPRLQHGSATRWHAAHDHAARQRPHARAHASFGAGRARSWRGDCCAIGGVGLLCRSPSWRAMWKRLRRMWKRLRRRSEPLRRRSELRRSTLRRPRTFEHSRCRRAGRPTAAVRCGCAFRHAPQRRPMR